MDAVTLAMAAKAATRKFAPDWLSFLDLLNDGSDGAYSPVSTGTLANYLYRFSSLNIPSGVTITPTTTYGGLIILVNGNANIDGLISGSGKGCAGGTAISGSAGTGGAGVSDAAFGVSGGGRGGSGYAASAPDNGTAGAGGTGLSPIVASSNAIPFDPNMGFDRNLQTFYRARGAGGGGGGSSSGISGVGGAGGSTILIIAKSFTGSGAVRADGIAGANTTGNAGAGGGGGGGVVVLVGPSFGSITVSAVGGAGGTNSGSNAAQNNGVAGGNGWTAKMVR